MLQTAVHGKHLRFSPLFIGVLKALSTAIDPDIQLSGSRHNETGEKVHVWLRWNAPS